MEEGRSGPRIQFNGLTIIIDGPRQIAFVLLCPPTPLVIRRRLRLQPKRSRVVVNRPVPIAHPGGGGCSALKKDRIPRIEPRGVIVIDQCPRPISPFRSDQSPIVIRPGVGRIQLNGPIQIGGCAVEITQTGPRQSALFIGGRILRVELDEPVKVRYRPFPVPFPGQRAPAAVIGLDQFGIKVQSAGQVGNRAGPIALLVLLLSVSQEIFGRSVPAPAAGQEPEAKRAEQDGSTNIRRNAHTEHVSRSQPRASPFGRRWGNILQLSAGQSSSRAG